MRNILLLLGALIFAASVWAAETASAPSTGTAATTDSGQISAASAPAATDSTTETCPQTCKIMNCPPPFGPIKKCCPVYPYTQTCP